VDAENLLIRKAQHEAFPDEMRAAENRLEVARRSDICGLAPYLDGNGVLPAYSITRRVDLAMSVCPSVSTQTSLSFLKLSG